MSSMRRAGDRAGSRRWLALATLSIYDGLNVWNNFILPLVLTQSNSVAVLPLGLTKLEGQ